MIASLYPILSVLYLTNTSQIHIKTKIFIYVICIYILYLKVKGVQINIYVNVYVYGLSFAVLHTCELLYTLFTHRFQEFKYIYQKSSLYQIYIKYVLIPTSTIYSISYIYLYECGNVYVFCA